MRENCAKFNAAKNVFQLDATWSLCKAGGKLWLGAKPRFLLTSVDQGKPWSMVDDFNMQSDRETWESGTIGLIPHTLVSDPNDPNKVWVFQQNGDIKERFPREACAKLLYSNDAIATRHAQTGGFLQGPCFFTLLR